MEVRLREEIMICQQQYAKKDNSMFTLRRLMERYREGQKKLHFDFVDLEKAYGRVPRMELYSMTVIRYAIGVID